MTTTPAPKGADIEQYRPGFEAWARARDPEFDPSQGAYASAGEWYYFGEVDDFWGAWTAAKRESISGSSTSTSQGPALKRYAVDYVNQELEERADGELVMFQDACGGNSGAAPGDALDAETITVIRSAIADYYRALNARQHGELAMDRSFRAIERELGMSWDMWTRAENVAIAASTTKGAA